MNSLRAPEAPVASPARRTLAVLPGASGGATLNLLDDTVPLLDRLLAEQQQLSAVDVFSRAHDAHELPAQAKHYSRLLPTSNPQPGEQYAFEVDLDRCSGCKSCVTACHARNGLDDKESWRDVGLLIGGTDTAPVMQHVTAACHHCVQPACLSACPVNAYEKDPHTGIVRHLDDQCFGCQYCTLACPYDVPKYHAAKGIVRKCDMCANRLAVGEAPACVQACPHEAIAIRIVNVQRVIEDAEASHFLPAAPEPHLTLPTTTYKTARQFPKNMLPADYYAVNPQHPHWPLIWMLVLTQLSVGAFAIGCLLDLRLPAELTESYRPLHALQCLCFGLLALLASTCHLGRPLYAFRGILGLRHSWLSREILAFGIFAQLAVLYAAACWGAVTFSTWRDGLTAWLPALAGVVTLAGIVGVVCSAMIYVFTRKDLWSFERTMVRFLLTAAILGLATTWAGLIVLAKFSDAEAASQFWIRLQQPLAQSLQLLTITKLVWDAAILRHLAAFRVTPLKRSAMLIAGPLRRLAMVRVAASVIGGVILPAWLLAHTRQQSFIQFDQQLIWAMAILWAGCLAGEVFERYLFFAAVASPRMPGGVRS